MDKSTPEKDQLKSNGNLFNTSHLVASEMPPPLQLKVGRENENHRLANPSNTQFEGGAYQPSHQSTGEVENANPNSAYSISNYEASQEEIVNQMGEQMGADFSSVNIHTESNEALQLGAKAFAQGENVHFSPGQFDLKTQGGKQLLGHELAHVIQQRNGRVQANHVSSGQPINTEPELEQEADQMGTEAAKRISID